MRAFRRTYWLVIVTALIVVALIAIATGPVAVPVTGVFDALLGQGDPTTIAIVRDLRLPRVVLGALVGAGLGSSGAVLQGALRNPLAEPYLLGVSGGAAVGAVMAFALGASGEAVVTLAAFGGSVIAVFVTLVVSRAGTRGRGGDPRTLVIAGVIVGAFANAVIMVALASAEPNRIRGALWWMMGSASDATWSRVAWLTGGVLIAGGAVLFWAREIDVLALGEDTAASLGVDVDRAGRRAFILAAILAAATVAAAGLVGFVGLVVPHIARAVGLRAHRPLIVAASLVGATLVVAADLAARTLASPIELPLGAITAILGVPFFLLQLRRTS